MQCNPLHSSPSPRVCLSHESGAHTLDTSSVCVRAPLCNRLERQYLIKGCVCVCAGGLSGGETVVQFCTNIKEHSSEVLTNNCHVVSLLSLENHPSAFICFQSVGLEEQTASVAQALYFSLRCCWGILPFFSFEWA